MAFPPLFKGQNAPDLGYARHGGWSDINNFTF